MRTEKATIDAHGGTALHTWLFLPDCAASGTPALWPMIAG